jgi:hypothetical protein
MVRKSSTLPTGFRKALDLYEVIYSVVFGAILGALFPDLLAAAASTRGWTPSATVAFVGPALVTTLFFLSYNARLRTGVFVFKREALTIVATAGFVIGLAIGLYWIRAWPVLTLFGLWTIPYLLLIVFGPRLRFGGGRGKQNATRSRH